MDGKCNCSVVFMLSLANWLLALASCLQYRHESVVFSAEINVIIAEIDEKIYTTLMPV